MTPVTAEPANSRLDPLPRRHSTSPPQTTTPRTVARAARRRRRGRGGHPRQVDPRGRDPASRDRPLTEVAEVLGRPYDAVRKERARAEAALRDFALYLSEEWIVIGSEQRSLDAGDVLGVEVARGVLHPSVEGAAVPLAQMAWAPTSQGPESSGAPRRPAHAGVERRGEVLRLEVVAGQADRAGGDDAGHLGVEVLGLDPLEALVEEALEGAAPDERQGLGAQCDGFSSAAGVGLAAQAQERGPVQIDVACSR